VSTRTRHHRDITQGSLTGHIWHLAWPIILSQALLFLPGLYDAIWLGQLGPEAQAAAGLTMTVRFVMISVLMALSVGSGALVARHLGAKDHEGANLASLQAVLLMVVSSGTLGLIGVVLAEPLMKLAGADESVLPMAVRYSRIIFAGLVAMELVPSIGFMLSSAGAPQVLLAMSLISAGTLLVLEPLLVRWMGIEGAALAIVLSNTAGMLWGLSTLVSGRAPVRLDLRHARLSFPLMGRIVAVAGPAVIQRGSPNLAMAAITRMVSAYGAATLAAWVIGTRIFNFAIIPSQGLGRTTPALVGQNLGAAKPDRAERSVQIASRLAVLVGVAALALLAIFASQVMSLFSGDPATIAVGAHMIRVLSVGQLALAINWVFDSAQSGAGDTVSPMTINLISLWLIQVPLAYVLSSVAGLGINGIWIGLVIGWISQMALNFLRFRQGRWKLKQV
jgi:putative MATE family efflux protein